MAMMVNVPAAGLCERCRHSVVHHNAKGSAFRLCLLSRTDARFPKYPRLPVLSCSGFDPGGTGGQSQANDRKE